MIWFTSDLHLGHQNIIGHTDRPWDSVDAMNDALIERINDEVATEDELYILGDFSFRFSKPKAAELRHRIDCANVHLVKGNHDRNWERNDGFERTFIVEPPILDLRDGACNLVLCHYPIMDWRGMVRGAIHLHGHIHATRAYNERMRSEGILRFDVGVDANAYRPVSLEQIRSWFDGIEPSIVRHLDGLPR